MFGYIQCHFCTCLRIFMLY